jgi:hypothetical protein
MARQPRHAHPAVRQYTLMAIFALLLLLLALIDQDLGMWALLPVVLGAVATLTYRERPGPPLVLALVTGLLLAEASTRWSYSGWKEEETVWSELAIAVSLLVYTLAHYRLLSLMKHIFPPDPRRHLGRALPRPRRSPEQVSGQETAALLYQVPGCTVVALLGWALLQSMEPHMGLTRGMWQAVVLVWLAVSAVAILSAVGGYLRRAGAGLGESLLYLQDQLWRDLRREQGEVQRWTAWARLRAHRRKETS